VEVAIEEERTTRVTLAGVNTTLLDTSADLADGHATIAGVSSIAISQIEDGDDDLQEDIRGEATSGGGTPSRDYGGGASGAGSALGQKANSGGVGVEDERVSDLFYLMR
jgi:hypothetical protein